LHWFRVLSLLALASFPFLFSFQRTEVATAVLTPERLKRRLLHFHRKQSAKTFVFYRFPLLYAGSLSDSEKEITATELEKTARRVFAI